ncbi:MAG: hypothetical protein ACE5R6_02695 [Candidatus Heimdallarchaeota archaeon]
MFEKGVDYWCDYEMKPVESLFQEHRYDILQILSKKEEGTTFKEILGNVARVAGRSKEDLDTGHGLVKAVYELVELDLIEKRGPDSYILAKKGKRILHAMDSLDEMERKSLSEPSAIQMVKLLGSLHNTSIYRLKSRLSSTVQVETLAEKLKDTGLVDFKESPLNTHRVVDLTARGEEACRVIVQIEAETQSRDTQQRRRPHF